MIIGVAAHLRRFIRSTPGDLVEERVRQREERASFGAAQLVPYLLLGSLLLVMIANVLSQDPTQIWNRPVLLFATVGVVALVVVRQLITQLENESLSRRQTISLERLAAANARVEEQARTIAEHNANLQDGIAHLKEVQAQIANGNMRARARIVSGELVSLAGSLNLMADRLLRFDQSDTYTQRLTRALHDLNRAIEIYRGSGRFILPASCNDLPEIQRLLLSMGMRQSQPSVVVTEQPGGQALSRPSSKPLAGPDTPLPPGRPFSGGPASSRSASSPLAQRSSSTPFAPRVPSSPLDPRVTGRPQKSSQNLSGSLRGSEAEQSEGGRMEFPPLPGWGNA
jgi:hypothetical protein